MSYIRCVMLTALLTVLMGMVSGADFHVTKTITLGSHKNVIDVVGLGPNTMAVIEGSLAKCVVTILSGDYYQNQVFRTQQSGLASLPKFQGQYGVLVNKGYFLYAKNYGKLQQYQNLNISGNVAMFKQDTYFSESLKCPTLTTFSSFYKRVQAKSYGNDNQCSSYAAGYLSQYENRYLTFAVKHTVLLIDRYDNYNALQTYSQPEQQEFPEFQYSGVDNYYKNETGQLTVLLKYSRQNQYNYGVLRRINNGPFQASPFNLYNPTSSFSLTGLNSGVSFFGDYIYRWQKLDRVTVQIDFIYSSQSLVDTFPDCVSYDETTFIQDQDNKIVIYSLPLDSYKIKKLNQVAIEGVLYISDARITKNNQFYVINIVKLNSYSTFCRVNATDLTVQCLNEYRGYSSRPELAKTQINPKSATRKNGPKDPLSKKKLVNFNNAVINSEGYLSIHQSDLQRLKQKTVNNSEDGHYYDCSQWASYSDEDLIVALCLNLTSHLFQLHLYKISILELIHAQDVYLGDVPPIFGVRLIRNQYKEQNDPSISDRPLFLLSLHISEQYDDAITFRYIVEYREYFIRQAPPSYDISFWNVYAYGNYIASIKLRNATTQTNEIRFFDFTSLKLIKSVPSEMAAFPASYRLVGYRNTLIIAELFGLRAAHIYDLKKSPNQVNWYRGSLYYQYFSYDISDPNFGLSIIFPKRKLQYFYPYDQDTVDQPLKQIFDISVGPVEQKTRMQNENTIKTVDIYKYLKAQTSVLSRDCEIVFYVADSRWLHKFKDCEEDKIATRLDLNPSNKPGTLQFTYLSQSDSRQNIVIKYVHTYNNHKFDIVEVRSIDDPSVIEWSSNKTNAGSQPLRFVNYIETIYGTSAVFGYKTKLTYQDVEQVFNSSYYELLAIDDIDANQQCTAFGGRSQQSGGKDSTIYYSAFNFILNGRRTRRTPMRQLGIQRLIVQNDSIKNLYITKDCSKIAVFTAGSSVLVWNITQDPAIIKNMTNKNYVNIQFSGNDKIVVQTATGSEIISLSDTIINQEDITLNAFKAKIATSKDGSFYALTTSELQVQINSIQKEKIRTFRVPANSKDANIVGLSFSDSNDLLVALSNSIVYVLSPTPCPDPFMNDNGVCLCQQNQTLINNTCECRNHFSPKGNTCICNLDEFIYENSQCLCSVNASELEGKCICHDNFVKSGAHCSCPTSFEYDESKLTCSCPYGYVDKQECIGCSFPCETCSGSSSSCNSYRASFYLLVIGGPVLLILIAVVVFCILRKKKKKDQNSELLKQQLNRD